MSLISYQNGAALFDATPIENMFLIEYLPTAPEEFLRVYLYARMLCLHPELGDSMEEISRALHMEEEIVESAFFYWEQQGLVQRISDRPPQYALVPMRSAVRACEMREYELQDMNLRLQAIFGSNLLHPQEYLIASEWVNELRFTQDAVVFFVEHFAKKSKSKKPDLNRLFKKLDKEAARLSDKGVKTLADMQQALTEGTPDDVAEAVLKRLSISRPASVPELELTRKWMGEWGYTKEAILAASGDTVSARQPTFAYLDKILESQLDRAVNDGLRAALRELGNSGNVTEELKKRDRSLLDAGFEPRAIEMAAAQTNLKRKHNFEDLEWMLARWRDEDILTAAAAEEYVRVMQGLREEMHRLLELAGSDKRPALGDIQDLKKWKKHHSADVIQYAARCAKGMQLPVKYMDKLLKAWQDAGVRDVAAAEAERAARQQKTEGGREKTSNQALSYAQNTYTDSDFGSDFYVDLTDGGEA